MQDQQAQDNRKELESGHLGCHACMYLRRGNFFKLLRAVHDEPSLMLVLALLMQVLH